MAEVAELSIPRKDKKDYYVRELIHRVEVFTWFAQMVSPKMLLTLASSADLTWYIMETLRSESPGYTTYVAV